jgi:FecR protein
MKKIFFIFVFFLVISIGSHAQIAKIIDVEGDVEFRKTPQSRYEKAKPDIYLDPSSGIKTNDNSECVIAFDEELENIIAINENSEITIESLKPGKVYMPRGRVFSLIENLPQLGKFEVRTPTAIAGIRGTGDSVETDGISTKIKCFLGSLWVSGVDSQGNPIGVKDLLKGSGLDVGSGGIFGDLFDLSSGDYTEWNNFIKKLLKLKAAYKKNPSNLDALINQLKDEYKDDIKDDFFEDFRNNLDDDSGGGGEQQYEVE